MLLSRLLLSPLAAAPLARAARRCYKVNGELEANDVPCYVDESKDSHCCGDIAGCNTNRVCSDLVHGDLGRGSCTDPTWKSPECPSFCHDEAAGGKGSRSLSSTPRHPQAARPGLISGFFLSV